jgi:tetratricopeptide (TPR) repeat protein
VDSLHIVEYPVEPLYPEALNLLPAETSPFFGRERELAEIGSMLRDPSCRMVNIVGPGGTGKSRLAVRTAAQCLSEFRNGTCFVSLAGIAAHDSVPSAIAAELGISQFDRAQPYEHLLRFLRNKHLLLVLDNYEHLLPETGLLTAILQAAPAVKLLITSRQRLNLHSEWIYLLDGLPVPPEGEHANLESFSSIRLFKQASRRVKPDFVLHDGNTDPIAQICRQVLGMPLAIELAAAWIPVMDPGRIAEEIGRGLDILEADLSDLPERQRSLRAVFDSSWKLLTEEEQQAMKMIAVFRGGFTLSTVRDIFNLPVKCILTLVNKCWVQPEAAGRFDLHELTRQYAHQMLQTDLDFVQSVEGRFSAYFCGVLAKHERNWFSAREREAFQEIDTEFQNIDASWNWAIKQKRLDLVVFASNSLACYYGQYLRLEENFAAMEAALQCMDSIQNEQGKESNAVLLARARAMICLIGKLNSREEIRIEFGKVRSLLNQLERVGVETRPEEAQILSWEGHLLMKEDPQKAFNLLTQAGSIYKEMGNDVLEAEIFYSIGEKHARLGDIRQAFHYINQCLQISKKTGYQRLVADSHMLMGILHRHSGNVEQAERYGRSSLQEYRKLGLRYDDGFALLHLCYTLMIAGKLPEALLHANNSLNVFNWLGTGTNHPAASRTMITLIMLHQGLYEQVEQSIYTSLDEVNNIQDSRVLGLIFDTAGAYMLVKQQEKRAIEHFQMSRQIYQKSNLVSMAGIPQANLAYVFLALNQLSDGEQFLIKCLLEAVQIGSYLFAIQALPALALYEAGQGNATRAIELYTLALKHPFINTSRWFDDIAGKRIRVLVNSLPQETVETARECGESLDLWHVIREWLIEKGQVLPGTNGVFVNDDRVEVE